MDYSILKDLAIIVVFAKCFGLLARMIKVPQVAGEIVAGLVIGPSMLGLVQQSDFLAQMAEIGVILLMFAAGLTTNMKDIKKMGFMAFLVACVGVAVPLACGYLLYSCFYGFASVGTEEFYKAVFIGTIMTATSVSITVQTLRELGHLQGRIGTLIVSAAIIDDVIGIIVLTFVLGLKNPEQKPFLVIKNTVLFFILVIIVGFIMNYAFKWYDKRYTHTRRIPIYGLALCLVFAYVAEEYFGIADITGAYLAGITLCSIRDSDYIARKMDVSSYMFFGPVFFASIGIRTKISGMTGAMIIFSICFVIVALISKIIGCGLVARLFKFKGKDALKVGVGMMTRGEVALIVSQKGLSAGIIDSIYFSPVILLIIISSILTPIFMKLLFRGETAVDNAENAEKTQTVTQN